MYDVKETATARTVAEAVKLLHENEAMIPVAGGTDVMIRMKERKLKEASLLSILDIEEIKGITLDEEENIIIGAGTCFTDIVENKIIQDRIPALGAAVRQVGSPQIRNIATIGGNLCNGAVSADSAPTLYALEAVLELESFEGVRRISVCDFHTGPGKTVKRRTEILTKVIILKENYRNYGAHYIKFGQRNAMEISTLGCAVNVKLDDTKTVIEDIRIAYGVAAPTPIRCIETENKLKGLKVEDQTIELLRGSVLKELQPRDSWRASKELRIQLIKELGCRATKQAIIHAGGQIDD